MLRKSTHIPEREAVGEATDTSGQNVERLALVSHDYNVADTDGWFDYTDHFSRINDICDGQGCDTILYALFTWDCKSSHPRGHDAFFGALRHVRAILLEVGEPPDRSHHVEVWRRAREKPHIMYQRFAASGDPGHQKQAFIDDLPRRRFGDALVMLCGETNIASLQRGSDDFSDPYGFGDLLGTTGVRLILNPIHDYMRRYEMKEKRRYYSRGGRTVVSVWNQGKGRESALPWTVYRDGEDRTAERL